MSSFLHCYDAGCICWRARALNMPAAVIAPPPLPPLVTSQPANPSASPYAVQTTKKKGVRMKLGDTLSMYYNEEASSPARCVQGSSGPDAA